ncbi:MAG: ABC transporter permease [Alphaproteobacteria bacterium]|nr:ABC transporter permease [Alphaproteobacteria bacterium]MBF0375638.1 ABC transporter permease [Alphaproteobacteria bacterium]
MFVLNLWRYRDFLRGAVQRELQARYRGSLLGMAWALLNPLAMIAVYAVIFSQVVSVKLPRSDSSFAYSIHLCAGVLTWGLFAQIIDRSLVMFVHNAHLVKKINFPRVCLPALAVLNSIVDFAIIFSVFIVFLLLIGRFPGLPSLALAPLIGILALFATGIGVALGTANVFFRDVEQMARVILQFWFWLTPIIYPLSILPESIGRVAAWNPLTPVMIGFQDVLVGGQWPDWASLAYPGVIALACAALGAGLFRRHAADIADEL